MPSNVDTQRAQHDAFNRRDFSLAGVADDCVSVDIARGLTLKGKGQVKEWLMEWTKSFSDGQITEATYHDAGDVTVAQFVGTGTQDGYLGPFPPSGKTARVQFCEIAKFNSDGQIVQITSYYDQLGMLAQLGHLPPPT